MKTAASEPDKIIKSRGHSFLRARSHLVGWKSVQSISWKRAVCSQRNSQLKT